MLKRFFLAVLTMSMASAMVAQTTFSLQGSLKDSKGEPIMFTNCVLLQQADSAFACGTTTEVDPYFAFDCGVSTDLFDRRLSLFLNVNDLFGTVRTGGLSVNPYNPSVSESTTESRYVSFGLTWRLGRTEMETQQTHGKKEPRKKGK